MLNLVELEERDIATDLGRIHVRVGPRSGPGMLFWPSLLLDGRMWLPQAEFFAPRYQVVLVDPPGHGQSQPLRTNFDVATCGQVFTQLLDGLGFDRVHLVGNSWGATIGATLAALHPERLRAAVLMNGSASPARVRQRLRYGAFLTALRTIGLRGPLLTSAVDSFVGPTTKRQRPEVVEAIRAAIADQDPASVAHALRSSVPLRNDQRPLLGRITTRVLVVAGREDPTFPVAETKEMADGIPGAEFVVLEDAAHVAALEVPDRVNSLVDDFLSRDRR
jgi:3-oxoadipate enol-lactonase